MTIVFLSIGLGHIALKDDRVSVYSSIRAPHVVTERYSGYHTLSFSVYRSV
jgi:hypothetical protein